MATVRRSGSTELPAVTGTINYTRPIAQRLHIDVCDFARTNM